MAWKQWKGKIILSYTVSANKIFTWHGPCESHHTLWVHSYTTLQLRPEAQTAPSCALKSCTGIVLGPRLPQEQTNLAQDA